MGLGDKIQSTGIIKYADGAWSAGSPPVNTDGILTMLVDVNNANPGAGNTMRPLNPNTSRPGYAISGGTYSGSYFINQNNPQGYTAASVFGITPKQYNLNYLHDYIHYPTDQMMVFSGFQNNSVHAFDFSLRVNSNFIMDVVNIGSGPYDPAGNGNNLEYYANYPGSAGAYAAGAINTDWTVDMTFAINGGSPPASVQSWTVDVYDAFGITNLFNSGPIDLATPGGPPFPQSYNTTFTCPYWAALGFQININ